MPRLPIGTRVPQLVIPTRSRSGWGKFNTTEFFAKKKVVVFGLPGAFTPTCSTSHVPRYAQLKKAFKAVGVDDVVCVSVNDAFVMERWQHDNKGADELTFLPDGNGEFTKGLGLLVDKSAIGFGHRSWRYAAVFEDGKVTSAFVEPEKEGDPFEVSDADNVLKALGGTAPPSVVLFTKPYCGFCVAAKDALAAADIEYDELPASPSILRALPGARTTPQVYIEGKHIGGSKELIEWIGAHRAPAK